MALLARPQVFFMGIGIMALFALADLHLSFGVPNKKMDKFGSLWEGHPQLVKERWLSHVGPDDIVLIAGDISWAMTADEALPDLTWIDQLPGTKVMIRGNHDYWWSSLKKVEAILPPSIKAIHNNALTINNISICGTRFWDSPDYGFASLYDAERAPLPEEDLKIYTRELGRLEMSLKQLDQKADHKIVMTHYPPIGLDLKESAASALFEKQGVSHVVFGHLHFPKKNQPYFGKARGVSYHLTACDFLDFTPLEIRLVT